MPLFTIGHNPKEDAAKLEAFDANLRAEVLSTASKLSEVPHMLSGNTTSDMFGTVFYANSAIPLGELIIDGFFNPREEVKKTAYRFAIRQAAGNTGLQASTKQVFVFDVSRWNVYPNDD